VGPAYIREQEIQAGRVCGPGFDSLWKLALCGHAGITPGGWPTGPHVDPRECASTATLTLGAPADAINV
jgi:hypothetical protein